MRLAAGASRYITVNGRRVDIPSFRVKPGDLVAIASKERDMLVIMDSPYLHERTEVPWAGS
jgi:small subunit ribosomal protein S4